MQFAVCNTVEVSTFIVAPFHTRMSLPCAFHPSELLVEDAEQLLSRTTQLVHALEQGLKRGE